MGSIGKIASIISGVAAAECIFAFVGALIAFNKGDVYGSRIRLVLLVVGVVVFLTASAAKKRWGSLGFEDVLARGGRLWWGSGLVYRCAVFAGCAWIVGSYAWLDAYDREPTLIFGPPIALLVGMWLFMRVVLGSDKSSGIERSSTPPTRPPPQAAVQSSAATDNGKLTPGELRRARERAGRF